MFTISSYMKGRCAKIISMESLSSQVDCIQIHQSYYIIQTDQQQNEYI
ncbi:hypothetical protein pb186bvf_018948 [Paramecium bursaria]